MAVHVSTGRTNHPILMGMGMKTRTTVEIRMVNQKVFGVTQLTRVNDGNIAMCRNVTTTVRVITTIQMTTIQTTLGHSTVYIFFARMLYEK